MTHKTPNLRPAMAAIAAVVALSSTQLLAQAVPDATPPVTDAPATTVPESAPAATTPSEPAATTPSEPAATGVSDPIASEPATTTTKTSKSTTTTAHRTASVARPAKAAPPVARAAVAAPVAAPAAPIAAVPAPVVDVTAVPPPVGAATPPAQDSAIASNDMLPIAGAAGLGLLGLIGAGVALRRRKLRREAEAEDAQWQADEVAEAEPAMPAEPAMTVEPAFEAPVQVPADPVVAERPAAPAPAFVLGAAPAMASGSAGSPSDCADAAPGSHVEAACDGPSADNPSLSIKKRLKRAHFFDQREQLAAAGLAVPVASDAGLPDAVEAPEAVPRTREPA